MLKDSSTPDDEETDKNASIDSMHAKLFGNREEVIGLLNDERTYSFLRKNTSKFQLTWKTPDSIFFFFSQILILVKNHKGSKTESIGNLLIPQISFGLKAHIIQCIEEKRLTEQHVSLAPSISYE